MFVVDVGLLVGVGGRAGIVGGCVAGGLELGYVGVWPGLLHTTALMSGLGFGGGGVKVCVFWFLTRP